MSDYLHPAHGLNRAHGLGPVMAGFGPAIHDFPIYARLRGAQDVDTRAKHGHDVTGAGRMS